MTKTTKKMLVGAAVLGLFGGLSNTVLADHHDAAGKCECPAVKGKDGKEMKCKSGHGCDTACHKAKDEKACTAAHGKWAKGDGHGH